MEKENFANNPPRYFSKFRDDLDLSRQKTREYICNCLETSNDFKKSTASLTPEQQEAAKIILMECCTILYESGFLPGKLNLTKNNMEFANYLVQLCYADIAAEHQNLFRVGIHANGGDLVIDLIPKFEINNERETE